MSGNKPNKARDEVVVEEVAEAIEAPVQVSVASPASPARRVTFDVWAVKRSVKESHKRGMRAFVKSPDRVRTIAEWDAALKAY